MLLTEHPESFLMSPGSWMDGTLKEGIEKTYRLYVIDKINKGKEAVLVDNYITSEKLREKVKRW